MAIDNDYIAAQFNLLGKLMDIHGENSFKTKSYSVAAFTLEKLPTSLEGLPLDKITSIKGIGDAIGKKIQEIQQTGELRLLKEYIHKTPQGVIEMLEIKGLGPKKIATIWKEMEVESIGELLYACQENRLLLYKGFGEKTQQSVREAIEFRLRNAGNHLFAEVEEYALRLDARLREAFPSEKLALTGDFRRQLEIVGKLEWVTTADPDAVRAVLAPEEGMMTFVIHHCVREDFTSMLFKTSCSGEFLEMMQENGWTADGRYDSEEALFAGAGLPYLQPFRREQKRNWEQTDVREQRSNMKASDVIQPGDVKAVIHSHSTWSDGSNTLEEMAAACIDKGFEYLVISDHSKSAFYANGLKEDRIKEQHAQIDELNRRLSPFVVFKSIECDILGDGTLDYSDDILSTFDLVIASVHSNLKMSEEKAMSRLLRAIENPYTAILGHMTGRLLLSRPGYPVDHKRIIDACVENQVVIELNAHPRRLDMDWRWVGYALDRGALISIDPDAHSIEGYQVIRYGVLAAQKAGLTKECNLSSRSLGEFRGWLTERKKARGI
ncbi:MAG TPA: helix-hairpin-helix domain-containing protein [Puia sp.]|jgi:DNA polymerase (family 10)|nr:helix-hairpin-helix domain-containing protein [Puia sp.]